MRIEPNVWTYIIAISGSVFLAILLVVQMMLLIRPKSDLVREQLNGKGGDWMDNTHFRSAYGFGWADWLIIAPLLIAGDILVLSGSVWGYILWIALGAVCLYFSIWFWVVERAHVKRRVGRIAYFTYFWGVYCYWGIAILVYSIIKLSGVLA